MLWDSHVDMEFWMIIGGIVWSIFWATVFYVVLLAVSRFAPGPKERSAPLENARSSKLAVKSPRRARRNSAAI